MQCNLKQLIQTALHEVVENMNASEETIARYFSKDYIQKVDGKILNYAELVAHMRVQKAALMSAKVTIQYLITEGDFVASLHVVDAIKKDGSPVQVQVNAIFKIQEGKIVLCDELTHLIQGSHADRDLGSRH